MNMPLEGYRVLDWTVFHLGPVASMMLGDLGAEVIKIEARGSGDPTRDFMKQVELATGVAGPNSTFDYPNRNKRSLAVDLRRPEGREIIYKLVEKSDVFLHNHREGVAARRGLDYAALSKHNPKLIYASASGWGPKGPDAEKQSFDYTGLAKSGIMNMIGDPGAPPQNIQGAIGDQTGAIITAYGVVVALLTRERTGIGQEVNTSLLSGLIWLQGLAVSMYLDLGVATPRWARASSQNPLWNHYQCKDDKWIALAHLQPDRHWPVLCKAMGIENLEKDQRFHNVLSRGQHGAELIAVMDKVFATKTREEWRRIFTEAGDIIFENVNTIHEVANDPQTLANDYITDFQHPARGAIKVVAPPVQFSKTPASMQRKAPELGEHTEEILIGLLGYSHDDVIKLKDQEVI